MSAPHHNDPDYRRANLDNEVLDGFGKGKPNSNKGQLSQDPGIRAMKRGVSFGDNRKASGSAKSVALGKKIGRKTPLVLKDRNVSMINRWKSEGKDIPKMKSIERKTKRGIGQDY